MCVGTLPSRRNGTLQYTVADKVVSIALAWDYNSDLIQALILLSFPSFTWNHAIYEFYITLR